MRRKDKIDRRMGRTGLEPPRESTGKTTKSQRGGAESGALGVQDAPLDPALAVVLDAWPKLPKAITAAIMALGASICRGWPSRLGIASAVSVSGSTPC